MNRNQFVQSLAIGMPMLAVGLAANSFAVAQSNSTPSINETWRAVEDELFAEINWLRTDPAGYAETVLEPLKENKVRIPEDESKPFATYRVILSSHADDHIDLREGESEEDSIRVIDSAIAALKETAKLPPLTRSEVLDAAARYYSQDWMEKKGKLAPHKDSQGRGTTERLDAFGTTRGAIANWNRFKKRLASRATATIYQFREDDFYYFVELPTGGGYRYWSVSNAFGEFVEEHGEQLNIPEIKKPGYQLEVTVDVDKRTLRHGEYTIPFPLPLPAHGENVVWGQWSRKLAARGFVCWWVLDPGIADRGHRKTLLDNDFRYCGIGCVWSRNTGWTATFDATSEPLVPHAASNGIEGRTDSTNKNRVNKNDRSGVRIR